MHMKCKGDDRCRTRNDKSRCDIRVTKSCAVGGRDLLKKRQNESDVHVYRRSFYQKIKGDR